MLGLESIEGAFGFLTPTLFANFKIITVILLQSGLRRTTSFLVVPKSFSIRNDQERGRSEEAWLQYPKKKLQSLKVMTHFE